MYPHFKSRKVLGTPKRCTIKRDSVGDVWLIILTDYVATDLESPTTGNNAGFDFGLKRYLTGSDSNFLTIASVSDKIVLSQRQHSIDIPLLISHAHLHLYYLLHLKFHRSTVIRNPIS